MGNTGKRKLVWALIFLIVILFRLLIPQYINDDAYISISYVKNFFAGFGFTFNPGEKHYVITNPGWTYLVALINFILRDPVDSVRLLGAVSEIFLLITAFELTYNRFRNFTLSMVLPVAIYINPVFFFPSIGGMETPLFLGVVLLSFLFFYRKDYVTSLAIAAIAIWIRFDGLILFFLLTFYLLFRRRLNFYFLLIPLIIFAFYFINGYYIFEGYIPAGVTVKSKPGLWFSAEWWSAIPKILLEVGKSITGIFMKDYRIPHPLLILVPFVIVGAFTRIQGRLLILYSLLHAAFLVSSGTKFALNFPWYFAPILPGVYFLAVNGIKKIPTVYTGIVLGILTTAGFAVLWAEGAIKYKYSYFPRERTYAAFAESLPPGGIIISANETGAIRYYSDPEIYIFDPTGLSSKSPENTKFRMDKMLIIDPDLIVEKNNFSYLDSLKVRKTKDYSFTSMGSLDLAIREGIEINQHKFTKNLFKGYDQDRFYLRLNNALLERFMDFETKPENL